MANTLQQTTELSKEVHRLELEMAKANATLVAQERTNEQLRAYLERPEGSTPPT